MNNENYIDVLLDIETQEAALKNELKALDAKFIAANKTKSIGDKFTWHDETYVVLSMHVNKYITHTGREARVIYKCAPIGKTSGRPNLRKLSNLEEYHFKQWAEIEEMRTKTKKA